MQRQAAGNAEVAPAFAAGFVCLIVQHAALGGEAVFGPLLFDVDERALARAEREVLQRGKRDGDIVGFGQMEEGSRVIHRRR